MLSSFEVSTDLIRDAILLDWEKMLFWVIIPFALVFIIAGFIGLERQNIGKAAGISAHILVGLGACGIAIFQRVLLQNSIDQNLGSTDGQRIMAQVVSGIGFLGAGVIIKDKNNIVKGLTTAATLWATAMCSLLLGSGNLITGSILGLIMILFIAARDISRKINPLKKIPDHKEDHTND